MKKNTRVGLPRLGYRVWAIFLSLAGGCGYHFAGESSFLPKDVRTIYVETFINRGRDVGLEKEITTALRGEFYRWGHLRVVDQAEEADLILTGVIRSFDSAVASVNRKDEALQYESTMTVDVTLRRREPNEILWREPGMRLVELHAGSRAAVVTTSSDFRGGTLNPSDVRRMTDIQLTEEQHRESRSRLMERLARELHHRLMEMF